jgi:hypothetical protein
MCRFSMAPREGHLKRVKRILAFLKTFQKGRVIIDTSYPSHSELPVEDHPYWKELYTDTEEEISNNLLCQRAQKSRCLLM